MRADPRMRICPAAHTHAPLRIYAHVRARTHVYAHAKKFSDIKSALQHYQTEFHHQSDSIHFYYPITVQFIYILEPHWQRHLYKLSLFVTHFPLIYHSLSHIYINLQTIYHSFTSHLSPIHFQFPHISPLSRTHHIPSLSDFHSNRPFYQYVSLL